MLKKIAILGAIVVAGLFLFNRTHLGSYAGTAWKKVKEGAKQSVPLEFEIECVKNEVSKLVPDMKKNLSTIADEMVQVENLREDIVVTKAQLDKQRDNVLTMRKDLESGARKVKYGDREYSAERVKEKLARDWESYKNCEKNLETKERLLETREQALAVEREKLATMRQRKDQLEVQVAQMDADLKNLRLAQTRSDFQIDDSRLARINASLASIRDRLKSEKLVTEMGGTFANDLDIPVEKRVKTTELLKDIDSHFGGKPAEVASDK